MWIKTCFPGKNKFCEHLSFATLVFQYFLKFRGLKPIHIIENVLSWTFNNMIIKIVKI